MTSSEPAGTDPAQTELTPAELAELDAKAHAWARWCVFGLALATVLAFWLLPWVSIRGETVRAEEGLAASGPLVLAGAGLVIVVIATGMGARFTVWLGLAASAPLAAVVWALAGAIPRIAEPTWGAWVTLGLSIVLLLAAIAHQLIDEAIESAAQSA